MAEKDEQIFSGKSHQFFPGSFVCIFGISGAGILPLLVLYLVGAGILLSILPYTYNLNLENILTLGLGAGIL